MNVHMVVFKSFVYWQSLILSRSAILTLSLGSFVMVPYLVLAGHLFYVSRFFKAQSYPDD